MKGAFGGGFATVGIPLLSLQMDPIAAGAVVRGDGYRRAALLEALSPWSKPDLLVLLPGLVVGIGLAFSRVALHQSAR